MLPALFTACGGDDEGGPPAVASGATTAPGIAATPGLTATSDEEMKIGFIALTDCASVVMAHELGFFKQYGLDVDVVKQASWASTCDALFTGDIHAAHMLFGMPFSVYTTS